MYKKLSKSKVFRDPLYGYIEVNYAVILELIDAKEVQRLRRIRQLSGVSMVFPTAEHSRFTHALGSYQMANLVLKNVEGANLLSEYEQLLLLIAALLHDIGHGPYSHAFEQVLSVPHEEMTARIIENKDGEIFKILKNNEIDPKDVANIIRKQSQYKVVEKLISSQLDVDRMDYLPRDAYFTGATYGTIDRNRILRSLVITNNDVYVKVKGVHSIESYLMSRYHMYFQVYYHPVARAYELLLEKIYLRIKDLTLANININANIESFLTFIKDNHNINEYIELDDNYVNGLVKQLTKSEDEILNILANALENRKLFKYIELTDDNIDISKYNKSKYFYSESEVSATAYLAQTSEKNKIKLINPDNRIISLEEYSPIIKSLSQSSYKKVKRIYYFER